MGYDQLDGPILERYRRRVLAKAGPSRACRNSNVCRCPLHRKCLTLRVLVCVLMLDEDGD